ncbi:bacterial Ig-like domain family protein [Carnobacterium maltaromaticum LMA28]|uniref:Bacterial Ig-like domain family protein n=1 Tax=Carnobacterium maltaromaticum LMA28 TaxID=1234679 RepID=K8E4V2_CARML|nr:Ig-like domain-containing protein [Carnobacterium maltaromaticum]CCO11580.2 bacterial Ig-like domain family protein [Carnobacterium maltaromaticum LMA28]
MPISNELLVKQMTAIQKAGNNVTLRDDNARAFVLDVVASSATLQKLYTYFAMSGTGTIDKLGIKRRTLKTHKGVNTNPDGTDIKEEDEVPFSLVALYMDTWIENSNTFYTARTRGQDVRQALLSLMQSQYSADLQDLAFNGDESSTDKFIKQNDGFIKLAKNDAVIKHSYKNMPVIQTLTKITGEFEDKYINGTYKWIMSRATNLIYVAEIQNRPTNLGDSTILGGVLTHMAGYDVEIVDGMENNVILFTPLENLTIVAGLNVTLTTAASDSASVAKQATYHFMLNDNDFIIRENKMIAYIDGKGTKDDPGVIVLPDSVSIAGGDVSLAVGATKQLNASILPDDTTSKNVSFKSNDKAIATVTAGGLVKGVADGETSVTVSTVNGKTASVKVTITA